MSVLVNKFVRHANPVRYVQKPRRLAVAYNYVSKNNTLPYNWLVNGRGEESYRKQYQRRAGVEGIISQGVRSFHLRSCRYIGLAKTRLQHILVAAAMNMTRMAYWLRGDKHARARITPFAALAFNFT